jgi:hypothetical protein
MPEITPEAVRQYIDHSGQCCPFCNDPDNDISGGPFDCDGGVVWQNITCDCGAEWQDIYTLHAIDPSCGDSDWIEPSPEIKTSCQA